MDFKGINTYCTYCTYCTYIQPPSAIELCHCLIFIIYLYVFLSGKSRPLQTNEWNKNDERLLAAVEHGEAEKVVSLLAKKGASAVKLDGEGKSA